MKTVQEEWRQYRDQVYPQGISGIQATETHQAFFAGANVMMALMTELTTLPEAEAVRGITKLNTEIMEVAQQRVATVKARN